MSILAGLPERAAVAVVRLRSLGDCVLTTPALALLKLVRPDLKIGVVVEDRFRDIFEGNPDIAEILPPGVGAVRRFRSDLCLNFHGGTRSMVLTAASGARIRAGFGHHKDAGIYNVRIPRAQEILNIDRKVHTAEHLASAIFFLGAPSCEIPRARLFARPATSPSPYAVIHAVAAQPEKTWPAANFLHTARFIRRDLHLDPVFIAGPGESLAAFTEFRTIEAPPLAEAKSLLAGSSLFLGNDSGPAHMAAAFGVPSVVLFGPSDADIWRPWKVESRIFQQLPIGAIEVGPVLEAAAQLARQQVQP